MTETTAVGPDPRRAHQRRMTRIWRIVFVVYALALVTGTHWPRLALGTEAAPAPDKLIHLVAFAGYAAFLWGARWFRTAASALLVAVGYTIIDELTQAIPGLGRWISGMDLASSLIGVFLTFAIGSAFFAEVGGEKNRMRLRARRAAYELAMSRITTWIALALAGGLGAGLGFVGSLAAINASGGVHPFTRSVFVLLAVFAFGFIGAHVTLVTIVRRIDAASRCDRCGGSLDFEAVDVDGWLTCAQCEERLHVVRRVRTIDLPRGVLLRLLVRPAIWVGATAALLAGLWTMLFRAAVYFDVLPHFTRFWRLAPLDFQYTVDLGVLGLLGALGVWRFRIGLARRFDGQDERCVECGHDVRYAEATRGVGRCAECGAAFARLRTPRVPGTS